MAKCNQLTSLPFKGLNHLAQFDQIYIVGAFGKNMNLLDFEVKRWKVKVTTRQVWSKVHFWNIFSI